MAYTEVQREEVTAALETSAARHGGTPRWTEVARAFPGLRLSGDTLRRWWRARTPPPPPLVRAQLPPPAPSPWSTTDDSSPAPDPATCTDIEYWRYRWTVVLADIGRCTSDTAMVALRKMQDEIRVHLRGAVEREREAQGLSGAEIEQELGQLAESMPPSHAQVMIRRFRARGLVA